MRVGYGASLLLATCGCVRPAGEIFPAVDSPRVWPSPPETPRIRYVGQIRTSADVLPARSDWQVFRDVFRPVRSKPIPLTTPHAVAIGPGDRIYVADTGSRALHVIDLARRTHLRIDSAGDRKLRSPVGVTVGSSGVFVTDAELAEILEFTLDGTYKRRLDVHVERPSGIVYCPANQRLYVIDTATHRCVAVSEEGEELFTFGQRGAASGKFNFPTYIAYSPLLGLIISDTLNFRVQFFELDGTYSASIGGKGDGAGDLSLPKGVAVDSDGNLYVVDAHFENVQIFRFDGQLLLAFGEEGSEDGQFFVPGGIAIDRLDRIWVADAYNRRLQVFQYLSKVQ